VIKLESVHIEWARGVARKLDLSFQRKNFAISGPNGSGKSAVIDAIEFALTGQIGRLAGSGTGGVSVREHGPHVDKAKFPDAAFVKLKVFIPDLGKSATITRKFKSPGKVEITPADDDVKSALAEVAGHPEITLSRRDIFRFILSEAGKRSAEIQTLLKLDAIGDTRSAFYTAQNRLQTNHKNAKAEVSSAGEAIRLHLHVDEFTAAILLDAANKKRKVLDLPRIEELTPDTKVDAGLAAAGKSTEFNKESALRDLNALAEEARGFPDLCAVEVAQAVTDLAKLEADSSLLAALERRSFIEKGLELMDGPDCPLCDTPWEDEEHLRHHLEAKLAKSEEAGKLEESLRSGGTAIADTLIRILGLIAPVHKIAEAEAESEFAGALADWKADLAELKRKLGTIDGLTGLKHRLSTSWVQPPDSLTERLQRLVGKVEAKPDQTATVSAQTFLTTAQLRLGDYRAAVRRKEKARAAAAAAKAAYDTYCSTLEESLDRLYQEVEADFSTFYRELNEDDESTFTAKLTPSEGKLDLDVSFYDRGLFPPGAYHSEGHQDGMGVCLYLALMKRLFGERFGLALLDDVVMSVDSGHRYQFCKLLREHYPDTQFIVTTHDRLWAEQMKSAGMITAKTSVAFHSWTIDTGPLVESNVEIWDEIGAALTKGKVEIAAAALRHHLEYASRHLADQIGASPQFRADGDYDLGELLPSVLARMDRLLGKAAGAAQSWRDNDAKEVAAACRTSLSTCKGASAVEQWAVNKAVHYNEWANFGKKDFEPVIAAFRDLLDRFRCEACDSWLYVTPKRGTSESLRCACSKLNYNLKPKSK
jgi:hypothetical protein